MRRPALYSRSPQATAAPPAGHDASSAPDDQAPPGGQTGAEAPGKAAAPRRHRRWLAPLAVVVLMAASAGGSYHFLARPAGHTLTQKDIDAAVLRTLRTTSLPSAAARAADIIRPSVVEVTALGPQSAAPEPKAGKKARPSDKRGAKERTAKAPPKEPPSAKDAPKEPAENQQAAKEPEEGEIERGVGTGVVIVDKGVILTNLHVVAGAEKIRVTFADGMESPATIIGLQPENDLAVLQAQKIPDDLVAATMRSTADLAPGDNVAVVGFPFGIGPSVSAGVVSGLNRSFRSPEGKQELSNLIQFDAAANPGNSGGPLVNMDGEVLGIVTAILNPTQQRTFVGIGFAVPIENAATAAGTPPF